MKEVQSIKEFRNRNQCILDGYIIPITETEKKEYLSILANCSIWEDNEIFAITAFGDVLAEDKEGFIILYRLIDGIKSVICANAELFFDLLADQEYLNDYFQLDDFDYAVNNVGRLGKNECYIYEPIPALGGDKSKKSMDKGKTLEYLSIVVSFI